MKRELDFKEKTREGVFPMLGIGNSITMHGVRTPFSATMEGLQMGRINEGINHLAEIDIMPILIAICLVIYILSLKIV